jgi:predicted metal-dependent hydrolase
MNEALDYRVRRSPRARRVRVSVSGGGTVEVTLPANAPDRAAAAAIEELRPWIDGRLAKLAAARRRLARAPGTLPLLGDDLVILAQSGRSRVGRRGNTLLVPADGAQGAIERWYRREARRQIEPRLDRATILAGSRYSGLVIRDQRTRWASCSPSGAMSFNWRLLLAPARILDYVDWHEVCHLEVMDHSPRFWALLERHWPDYRADRRWLRDNGPALTLS